MKLLVHIYLFIGDVCIMSVSYRSWLFAWGQDMFSRLYRRFLNWQMIKMLLHFKQTRHIERHFDLAFVIVQTWHIWLKHWITDKIPIWCFDSVFCCILFQHLHTKDIKASSWFRDNDKKQIKRILDNNLNCKPESFANADFNESLMGVREMWCIRFIWW